MDLADETVARLNKLTPLTEPGNIDLLMLFRDLVRSAAAATSCLAVIITLDQEPPFFALDARLRNGTGTVRSSLRAQIVAAGQNRRHQVVFLAEEIDEYAHFAARHLQTFAARTAWLDHHAIDTDLDAAEHLLVADLLPAFPAGLPAGTGPPARQRTIDHALGFLIDRGLTPDQGLQELLRRAHAAGNTIHDQALLVLARSGETP